MVVTDKPKFKIAMAAMAEVFRVECPGTLQASYWLVLSEMSIEDFESACSKAMLKLKWFPKPAELIEVLAGNEKDMALEAWRVFNQTIDVFGGGSSPKFTDPVLVKTIHSTGGWAYACGLPRSEFESFYRMRWLEAYRSFFSRGVGSDRPLLGSHDRRNRIAGDDGLKQVGEFLRITNEGEE